MMNNKIHPVLAGASLVLIVAGLRIAAPILNPVLLAALLAISIAPLLHWQLRRGWPKGLAVLLTILVVALGGLVLTTLVGVSIARLAEKIPTYHTSLTALRDATLQFLAAQGIVLHDLKSIAALDPKNLMQLAAGIITGVMSAFGNSMLILLLIVFMLIETGDFRIRFEKGLLSPNSLPARFGSLSIDIRKYVVITAQTGLLAAVANTILLIILGVDFPGLWGFLSFLFNFIPNIGMILTVIPPALLALLEFGLGKAVIVVAGFVLINAVVENVIKPRFMGQELEMSMLLIFLSLIFWSWVLGMTGAILAVPLTMLVKKVMQEMSSREVATEVQAHSKT